VPQRGHHIGPLGGEVRRVARLESRVREATRLGFTRILVPASERSERAASQGRAKSIRFDALAKTSGAQLVPVDGVADAVAWLHASRGTGSSR
jgi:predicted ATP-dependent serine protease